MPEAEKQPWKPFYNSKPWKIETYRTVPLKLTPPPKPFLPWLWNPALGPKPPEGEFKSLGIPGKG